MSTNGKALLPHYVLYGFCSKVGLYWWLGCQWDGICCGYLFNVYWGGGGGNLKINFFSEMRFIQGVLALKVEGSVVIWWEKVHILWYKGRRPKKKNFFWRSFPNVLTHSPTQGFLRDLGKQKVKFGSKKAIFAVIWGVFEGVGPCLGISHPTHPHLEKISQKKGFFTPYLNSNSQLMVVPLWPAIWMHLFYTSFSFFLLSSRKWVL